MFEMIREQVPMVTDAKEMYLALYDKSTEMIHFPLGCFSWRGGEA